MARLREFFDELISQNPKEKDTLGKIETNVFTKVKAGSINITNLDVVYTELKNTYKYKESK